MVLVLRAGWGGEREGAWGGVTSQSLPRSEGIYFHDACSSTMCSST